MQRRAANQRLGAVLFTDIVGSTAIAAEMGNSRWSELVARHHRIVRRQLGSLLSERDGWKRSENDESPSARPAA